MKNLLTLLLIVLCSCNIIKEPLYLLRLRKKISFLLYLKDEQLMDFFKTVEIRDLEGIKTYIKENGSSVVLNSDDYLENLTTGINFGICLHIPRKSQGFVFAYSLYDTTNELRIFVNHGMEQYHISSNEIEDKKSIVYTDQEMNEITKNGGKLTAEIVNITGNKAENTILKLSTYEIAGSNKLDKITDTLVTINPPHIINNVNNKKLVILISYINNII